MTTDSPACSRVVRLSGARQWLFRGARAAGRTADHTPRYVPIGSPVKARVAGEPSLSVDPRCGRCCSCYLLGTRVHDYAVCRWDRRWRHWPGRLVAVPNSGFYRASLCTVATAMPETVVPSQVQHVRTPTFATQEPLCVTWRRVSTGKVQPLHVHAGSTGVEHGAGYERMTL